MLKSLWEKAGVEDRIVLLRFMMGLIYGLVAYILYRLNLSIIYDTTTTIWFFAAIIYSASIYIVERKLGGQGLFMLLLRGLLTFYTTWIIIVFVLYDLLG